MIGTLLEKLRAWVRTRGEASPLRIVAARPLHGGAAVYVADVDGRRLIFAAGPNALCMLASYDVTAQTRGEYTLPASTRRRGTSCDENAHENMKRQAPR